MDILIPAALENAITEKEAELIKAKLICEAANGPTTVHADEILNKGIPLTPDILTNAGELQYPILSGFKIFMDIIGVKKK